MSIFDITRAGTYMNAIEAAYANDQQNARHLQQNRTSDRRSRWSRTTKAVETVKTWASTALDDLRHTSTLRSGRP